MKKDWPGQFLFRIVLLLVAAALYFLGQWLYQIRQDRATPRPKIGQEKSLHYHII